jgi:hypothetical protein
MEQEGKKWRGKKNQACRVKASRDAVGDGSDVIVRCITGIRNSEIDEMEDGSLLVMRG